MANNSKQIVLAKSPPPATTTAVAAEEEDPSGAVFVDTTLDTRLLIPVSSNDTVSDFRRKIEKEHALCFSNIGEIVVRALKVTRRGKFYHLSDSMLVKHAFGLSTKNWFMSVDASVVEKKCDEGRDNNGKGLVDGFGLTLDGSPEQENGNDQNRERERDCRSVLDEEALRGNLVGKKRKHEVEQIVVNGDLQEDVGLGKHISESAVISQPLFGDKERSENLDMEDNYLVTESLDTCKGKKRRKLKSKLNQEFDGGPSSKEFNVPIGISTKQEHSDAILAVGECEVLAVDANKTDKTEEETSVVNKLEALKDRRSFDIENIPPSLIMEPEDVQMAEEHGALSKKSDSPGMQLSNLISTRQDETEARVKVVDAAGKKKKSERKNKGSAEKVLPKPLETKSSKQLDDKAGNEGNDLLPTKGNKVLKENIKSSFPTKEGHNAAVNEVGTIENKEMQADEEGEPVKKKKKKSRKKQKSTAIDLPDVQVEPEDENLQNTALHTVTESELLASSNTKTVKALVELESLGVQNAVLAESKSVSAKSTEAQSHSLVHVDKADLADDIRRRTDETEDETSAPNKIETLRANLETNLPREKEPKDLQMYVEGSPNQDETAVKTKDINITVHLVDEDGSVVPREASKKRRSKSLGVQNTVLAESKSASTKSTKAQTHSLGHVNEADLADGTRRKTDETKVETSAPSKVETVKRYLSVNLESNLPREMKEPKYLQMCVEAPSNLDETEVKTKDVDSAADLVDENESVVPRDAGKKRRRSKRAKGSVGDVVSLVGAKFDNQPDGNERPKENTESTFLTEEDDGTTGIEEEPVKRKSKKKRKSTMKNAPGVQEEPEDVNRENLTQQTVTESEVSAPLNTKKKRKVVTPIQDQPIEGKLESESLGIQSSQMKVSEVGNKSISEQPLPSVTASSEVNLSKAKMNAKNPDTHLVETSLSSAQSSLKSNRKQGITGKSLAVNSSTILAQEAVVEEKSDESMVHSEKKLPKASKETEGKSVVDDTGKNLNSGKINDDALVVSNRLEGPRIANSQSAASNKGHTELIDTKVSDNNNGETIKGLESKRKLIATPGSIFGNDSDGISDDDEGMDDSDDSTKAPSEYSSDYSDGESNANFKSPQKGSLTSDKTNSADKRNILKSCSSSGKDLTFDTVLRSSTRYKKAQLTASQSQHEYESQQVDFVPDSQPN